MNTGRKALVTRTDAVLALAALAIVGLAIGCGKQKGQEISSTAGTTEVTAVVETPKTMNVATPAAALVTTTPEAEATDSALGDSLPPDVTATIPTVSITPGGIIEIAAETSPDVVEVTLSDGRGKPQAFVYDATAKAWRVLYRMPLRAKDERGLSVTAKNSLNRWKRVWVFPKTSQEAAAADSSAS